MFNRPLARPRAFCRRFFQARRTSVAEVHGARHDHVVGHHGVLGRLAVRPRSAGCAQKGKENNQINNYRKLVVNGAQGRRYDLGGLAIFKSRGLIFVKKTISGNEKS